MANFIWEDNTQQIYEDITSLTPGPFKQKARELLDAALIKRIGENGTVTEPVLVECIKETTPKPFIPLGMRKIRHLLKNKY